MKLKLMFLFLLVLAVVPAEALAGLQNGELSVMGSYSRTNYGAGAYSVSRRYQSSIGVVVTPTTQIELSYTYTDSFFNYDPIQTTDIEEKALSLSVVQSLVPPTWVIQPYVKAGAAQHNREQSGTVSGVPTTPSSTKSPSGVVGGGIRIFLLRNFSLKIEGVTFLPDLKFKEAHNNFSIQGGIGWYF